MPQMSSLQHQRLQKESYFGFDDDFCASTGYLSSWIFWHRCHLLDAPWQTTHWPTPLPYLNHNSYHSNLVWIPFFNNPVKEEKQSTGNVLTLCNSRHALEINNCLVLISIDKLRLALMHCSPLLIASTSSNSYKYFLFYFFTPIFDVSPFYIQLQFIHTSLIYCIYLLPIHFTLWTQISDHPGCERGFSNSFPPFTSRVVRWFINIFKTCL